MKDIYYILKTILSIPIWLARNTIAIPFMILAILYEIGKTGEGWRAYKNKYGKIADKITGSKT